MYVVLITDPIESFHRHFNAQFTSPHPTFFIFWDDIVKQQTVTYITVNDLNTTPLITTVERRRQQRLFPAGQKFQISTAVVHETAVLARSRLQLCCGIRFIGEFQRLAAECIGFTHKVCIATCDFGILRAERYFVILDFFFVILDYQK